MNLTGTALGNPSGAKRTVPVWHEARPGLFYYDLSVIAFQTALRECSAHGEPGVFSEERDVRV